MKRAEGRHSTTETVLGDKLMQTHFHVMDDMRSEEVIRRI